MRITVLLMLVVAVSSAAQTWTSGEYRYDGAGNIVSIGDRSYGYDAAGRLTKAQIGSAYGYEYDAYGNRTAYVVDQQRVTVPVASATNQLADATYDAAGNQLSRGATAATFDGFGMVTSYRFDAVNAETFVYTASDERIGVLRGDEWTWSIRDPGGRVLRQYRSSSTNPGAPWTWVEDFVHRGSLLLGSERAPADGGRRHSHLDHLGSPRLVTSDAGSVISTHDFLPFGEERMPVGQQLARGFDREHPHRFTGHERDFDVDAPGASSAYVDYMHARYYAAATGRFLSVDPGKDWDVRQPQSWNMYSYVRNNPVNQTDPTGRYIESGIEIASIGIGGYSLYRNIKAGKYWSAAIDGVGIAVDAAALAVPLVPGGAGAGIKAVRAANAIDNAGTGGRTANIIGDTARGRASEARVLDAMGLKKNNQKVTTSSGTSIPDAQDATRVVEVKDTQRASNTNQMRVQREHAQETGREHVVVTGTGTKVSKPLEEKSTVVRRTDLGPPQ